MNSISAKLKSEIKRTLYTKWIWFAGFLACLLGKITQMAGQDSITWRCIFIASAILISEVFWLFELKSPKDEAVLCTKYGSKKSSDSVGARVIDFINFRFIILSE